MTMTSTQLLNSSLSRNTVSKILGVTKRQVSKARQDLSNYGNQNRIAESEVTVDTNDLSLEIIDNELKKEYTRKEREIYQYYNSIKRLITIQGPWIGMPIDKLTASQIGQLIATVELLKEIRKMINDFNSNSKKHKHLFEGRQIKLDFESLLCVDKFRSNYDEYKKEKSNEQAANSN